jgi:hypothetical protein
MYRGVAALLQIKQQVGAAGNKTRRSRRGSQTCQGFWDTICNEIIVPGSHGSAFPRSQILNGGTFRRAVPDAGLVIPSRPPIQGRAILTWLKKIVQY